ncbi:MAG: murein biosynthesis integral membrane protein MurJ [Candidatus Omnitrophica bacterium]|nr:murein biosynthesis integral membrane protein MurJ [Candidatus Omnitrophota bacterium]
MDFRGGKTQDTRHKTQDFAGGAVEDRLSPTDTAGERRAAGVDSKRAIVKSTSVLFSGTLASRVLGFVRDVILARLLGTGWVADAFFVAQKIPNLLRDMVGEGASNAAIVPVLAEYKETKDREELNRLVNLILFFGTVCLGLIAVAGIIMAPWVVRIMAPGFYAAPAQYAMTVSLTRVIFPYLVLIGLTAYSMGVLYTFRSFAAPAYSPCLFNIALIITTVIAFWWPREQGVYWLAFGILLGGFMQLAWQTAALKRCGIRHEWPRKFAHPGMTKISRLIMPRMLGNGVYQLSVFVDTFCASLASIVGPGGISAIYFANRLLQLPMGLFGVSLASAVLPSFSALAAQKDMTGFKRTLVFALENIFFVMCPMMVLFLLFAGPMIRLMFQRGAFDTYSTAITASALAFYSLGLFGFGTVKILVSAFYSLQDTKTPVKIAGLCLLLSAALNALLIVPFGISGIALSSAVTGTINAVLLYMVLNRRIQGMGPGLWDYARRITLAGILMFGVGQFVYAKLGLAHEWEKLTTAMLLCVVVYWGACYLLNIDQARKAWQVIMRHR